MSAALTHEQEVALHCALTMYAGEPCRICGVVLTFADVENGGVFAGYSLNNVSRSAHKTCWDAHIPKAQWALALDAST